MSRTSVRRQNRASLEIHGSTFEGLSALRAHINRASPSSPAPEKVRQRIPNRHRSGPRTSPPVASSFETWICSWTSSRRRRSGRGVPWRHGAMIYAIGRSNRVKQNAPRCKGHTTRISGHTTRNRQWWRRRLISVASRWYLSLWIPTRPLGLQFKFSNLHQSIALSFRILFESCLPRSNEEGLGQVYVQPSAESSCFPLQRCGVRAGMEAAPGRF